MVWINYDNEMYIGFIQMMKDDDESVHVIFIYYITDFYSILMLCEEQSMQQCILLGGCFSLTAE